MEIQVHELPESQLDMIAEKVVAGLVDKYPNQFGVGASVLTKGTEAEQQVLKIADLL